MNFMVNFLKNGHFINFLIGTFYKLIEEEIFFQTYKKIYKFAAIFVVYVVLEN